MNSEKWKLADGYPVINPLPAMDGRESVASLEHVYLFEQSDTPESKDRSKPESEERRRVILEVDHDMLEDLQLQHKDIPDIGKRLIDQEALKACHENVPNVELEREVLDWKFEPSDFDDQQ